MRCILYTLCFAIRFFSLVSSESSPKENRTSELNLPLKHAEDSSDMIISNDASLRQDVNIYEPSPVKGGGGVKQVHFRPAPHDRPTDKKSPQPETNLPHKIEIKLTPKGTAQLLPTSDQSRYEPDEPPTYSQPDPNRVPIHSSGPYTPDSSSHMPASNKAAIKQPDPNRVPIHSPGPYTPDSSSHMPASKTAAIKQPDSNRVPIHSSGPYTPDSSSHMPASKTAAIKQPDSNQNPIHSSGPYTPDSSSHMPASKTAAIKQPDQNRVPIHSSGPYTPDSSSHMPASKTAAIKQPDPNQVPVHSPGPYIPDSSLYMPAFKTAAIQQPYPNQVPIHSPGPYTPDPSSFLQPYKPTTKKQPYLNTFSEELQPIELQDKLLLIENRAFENLLPMIDPINPSKKYTFDLNAPSFLDSDFVDRDLPSKDIHNPIPSLFYPETDYILAQSPTGRPTSKPILPGLYLTGLEQPSDGLFTPSKHSSYQPVPYPFSLDSYFPDSAYYSPLENLYIQDPSSYMSAYEPFRIKQPYSNKASILPSRPLKQDPSSYLPAYMPTPKQNPYLNTYQQPSPGLDQDMKTTIFVNQNGNNRHHQAFNNRKVPPLHSLQPDPSESQQLHPKSRFQPQVDPNDPQFAPQDRNPSLFMQRGDQDTQDPHTPREDELNQINPPIIYSLHLNNIPYFPEINPNAPKEAAKGRKMLLRPNSQQSLQLSLPCPSHRVKQLPRDPYLPEEGTFLAIENLKWPISNEPFSIESEPKGPQIYLTPIEDRAANNILQSRDPLDLQDEEAFDSISPNSHESDLKYQPSEDLHNPEPGSIFSRIDYKPAISPVLNSPGLEKPSDGLFEASGQISYRPVPHSFTPGSKFPDRPN